MAELSITQVSVQPRDANLGHQAALKGLDNADIVREAIYRQRRTLRFKSLKTFPVRSTALVVQVEVAFSLDPRDNANVARIQPNTVETRPRPTIRVSIGCKSDALANTEGACTVACHVFLVILIP